MINKIAATVLAFIVGINLAGCSTNTQKENTAAGAIAGGLIGGGAGAFVGQGVGKAVAIGVGIVGGALIGGYIGNHMDSSDSAKMNTAMNNPTNQATRWKNEKTGARYSMRPTSNMIAVDGNPACRRFHTTAIIEGKTQRVNGVACQQANGSWQVVKA